LIYEIRSYRLRIGSMPEVEKRFAEAYDKRKQHSELTASLRTELGPLSELVHIWRYESLAERTRVEAEASGEGTWPPKIDEFIIEERVEVISAFSFVPTSQPGKVGPIFELRSYRIKPGLMAELARDWEKKLPERQEMSPLLLAGPYVFGETNTLLHLWSYPTLEERSRIRAAAQKIGWPPASPGRVLAQEAKILLPTSFSPLQ
jgi:hypothetical protein